MVGLDFKKETLPSLPDITIDAVRRGDDSTPAMFS